MARVSPTSPISTVYPIARYTEYAIGCGESMTAYKPTQTFPRVNRQNPLLSGGGFRGAVEVLWQFYDSYMAVSRPVFVLLCR